MAATLSKAGIADPVAPMRRTERLGLGIAAAAHVALLVGMIAFEREPEAIPIPERISVTVSDEIALESISPNPMANPAPSVAEELGEPEPPSESVTAPSTQPVEQAIEPRPALVPSPPRKAVTPQPAAKPKPAPRTERRRPDTPSRGSRIGNDFLAGSGGSGTDADQPAKKAGPLTASSLASAISRQLRPHWSAPQGAEADQLVTVLSWEMNPNGSLKGHPRVVSQSGVTDANAAQKERHAELAIRAVQLAAPFDLPDEYYDTWKRVSDFRFDRRL